MSPLSVDFGVEKGDANGDKENEKHQRGTFVTHGD
jgi:hypothetical protein